MEPEVQGDHRPGRRQTGERGETEAGTGYANALPGATAAQRGQNHDAEQKAHGGHHQGGAEPFTHLFGHQVRRPVGGGSAQGQGVAQQGYVVPAPVLRPPVAAAEQQSSHYPRRAQGHQWMQALSPHGNGEQGGEKRGRAYEGAGPGRSD